jgi:hypothetical protein
MRLCLLNRLTPQEYRCPDPSDVDSPRWNAKVYKTTLDRESGISLFRFAA